MRANPVEMRIDKPPPQRQNSPMNRNRRSFLAHGAALAAFPFAARVSAADPIVIKFSHVVAADTPKGQGAVRFKEVLESRSAGRIRVEVYPNSTLYKDKEELEALQIGAVQMLAPSLSKFGPLGVRQFELFDLPCLFPDEAAFRRVADGDIGRQLFSLLANRDIKGLAFWSAGFHVYSANRPIRLPGDLRGLKMRIPSSKVLEANLRALGALPQTLAFSDVYQALQTGVVDGTENIPSSYTSQKWYEVQKYIAVTNHTHTGYAAIMNKPFWEGLSPEYQGLVSGAMKEATAHEDELVAKENADALKTMQASGKTQVAFLTDSERAAWKSALAPVAKEMESRIGAPLLQSVTDVASGKA
jgi:C4-dicarboxylate-binding protein DctP